MIPVSANFTARRKAGHFLLDQLYELFIPISAGSSSSSSATAGYPDTAVIDGDRTHLNAGPLTGAYPPPAGPENFIGGGMWKASGAVPQSVTLYLAGASVGMVRLYSHPVDGGVKSFKLQTAAAIGGPYTDVTGILRARAWEKWNGPSTVTVLAGVVTAVATSSNIPSVPSVFEVVLDPAIAPQYLRVLIADAGPTPASDGLARLCEVEAYRRVDITSRLSSIEVAHQTDIRMQGVNARQGSIELWNADQAFVAGDFQRAASGQTSLDAVPILYVHWGIDGELVRVATMGVDEAQFNQVDRKITLRLRGWSERAMFDRLIGAYRTGIELDEAVALAWSLCNLPQGLVASERNPHSLDYFLPDGTGRSELEDLRKAEVDRGAFVKPDATLGSMAGTFSSLVPWATTGTNPGHPNDLVSYRQDALFFDPVNPYLLIYAERTFQTLNAQNALIDTDADRLSVWDVRQPVSTRTQLCTVFNRAGNVQANVWMNRVFAVPSVMARRPATNDFYFLTGGEYPCVLAVHGPNPLIFNVADAIPPFLMSAYTIANGIATPIFVNRAIAHNAECAAFVGTTLYWWDAPYTLDPLGGVLSLIPRTARLWKWDVTTPYLPVLVGTIANVVRQVGGMVAVGTRLYWTEMDTADGRIAWWDTATFPAFAVTTLAQPYGAGGAEAPLQIANDGAGNLWGTGQLVPSPQGYTTYLWRVVIATGAVSLSATRPKALGALTIKSGQALFVDAAGGMGAPTMCTWDGVNGTYPKLISVAQEPAGNIREVGYQAIAVSPASLYGKRVIALWFNRLNTGPFLNISPAYGQYFRLTIIDGMTFYLYKDVTDPPADTITTSQVLSFNENISYELGGANAVVNAVDTEVITRSLLASQPVYTAGAAAMNPQAYMVTLNNTVNPLSLASAPLSGVAAVRRHAKIPQVVSTLTGGGLLGTIASDLPSSVRVPSPYRLNQPNDPGFMNVVDLNSKYFVTNGLAYNAALRVLGEASQALRWPTIEMPIFPEVELNDELVLAFVQRSDIVPVTITGRFRVTAVTHRVAISKDGCEARTTLELVLIPTV